MIPIIGFCGISDSGKTTLIRKITKKLSELGFKIGIIKHHRHTILKSPKQKIKDTDHFLKAGAKRVILSQKEKISVFIKLKKNKKNPIQIANSFLSDLDFIFVEGYKYADIDKIQLTNIINETTSFFPKGQIIALIYKEKKYIKRKNLGIPIFNANELNIILKFIISYKNQNNF